MNARNIGKFNWLVTIGLIIIFNCQFILIVRQLPEARSNHRITRINFLKPQFAEIARYVIGLETNNVYLLKEAVRYYKEIVHFYPAKYDAYLTLGYCQFKLGQKEKAQNNFEKSIELNPEYFWPYYNRAQYLFFNQDYAGAARYLTTGLSLDFAKTSQGINESLIFRQIDENIINYNYEQKMRSAIGRSYIMMLLSYYYLGEINKLYGISHIMVKNNMEPKKAFQFLEEAAFLKMKKNENISLKMKNFEQKILAGMTVEIF